ncbi:MAG: GntR family transcriptional regulator [Bacillota bacterium]
MQFKEIVAPSMKELFVNNIEELILSGQLKIGEKLPPERELAEQMRVSRTIVNLGLAELAKKGFLDIHPRQGVYVSDYVERGNLETLLSIMNFNGGKLDFGMLSSICEFRRIVEGRAYELAAQNRTQEDLEMLFGLLQKVNTTKNITELSDYIFEFHHVVFCASKNCILPLVHNGLESISKRITNQLFETSPNNFVINGIEKLYHNIKSQDAQGAKNAIIEVIDKGMEYMSTLYH